MGEYTKYRKTSVIEVVGKDESGMIVQNVGNPDDRWTVPFDVFDTTYVPETRVANPQVENNFKYHKADEAKGAQHDKVRSACKELAYTLDELLPNSREKSLAMTKLEEVMMWANAGIARN
ncbi:hypothetical protein D1872_88670 [compost metagenome]